MLIELTRIKDLPVGSFEEGGMIGKVKKVIINPEEGRVIGFLVKLSGFFSGNKIVSLSDVIDTDQGGLVVRSVDSLVEKDEVVRISELLKNNFEIIGLKAINKEKNYLGRVAECLINTDTGDIMRIYVKKLLASYVFERSQIEEITLKMVKLRSEKRQKLKKQSEVLAQAETA